MKKILSVLMLILCCLLTLCSCDNSPYAFYVKRATAIQTECKAYSLKRVDDLKDNDNYYAITANDYVSRYYLLDPDSDGKADKEFYNYGGLYVYMSNRKIFVYNNQTLEELNVSFFREHSQTYNEVEKIWTGKYKVEPSDIPNLIVGAVVFDNNVFILAQNNQPQIAFDHEHTANLWRYDLASGKLEFCGFCEYRDGTENKLSFFDDGNVAIVKN